MADDSRAARRRAPDWSCLDDSGRPCLRGVGDAYTGFVDVNLDRGAADSSETWTWQPR